jgi:hypothetical protein
MGNDEKGIFVDTFKQPLSNDEGEGSRGKEWSNKVTYQERG